MCTAPAGGTCTVLVLRRGAAKVHRLAILRRLAAARLAIADQRPATLTADDVAALAALDPHLPTPGLAPGLAYCVLLHLPPAPASSSAALASAADLVSALVGPCDTRAAAAPSSAPAPDGHPPLRDIYGSDAFYAPPASAAPAHVSMLFPGASSSSSSSTHPAARLHLHAQPGAAPDACSSDAPPAGPPPPPPPQSPPHPGLSTTPSTEPGDRLPASPREDDSVYEYEQETLYVDADDIAYDENGRAYLAATGEPLELQEIARVDTPDEADDEEDIPSVQARTFRAKAVPASLHEPSIQPRLSRAAMLRMGIPLPPKQERSHSVTSSASDKSIGISGLPKAPVPTPHSLAPPTVKVRMNRAAAARLYQTADALAPEPRVRKEVDFSATPGHKRPSLGVHVAALDKPAAAPRETRASAARKSGSRHEQLPPTPPRERKPFDFSTVRVLPCWWSCGPCVLTAAQTPGHKRSAPVGPPPVSLRQPAHAPRSNRAAEARKRKSLISTVPMPRVSTPDTSASPPRERERERKEVDFSSTPGHRRASIQGLAPVPSLRPPLIAPRANSASNARAAQKDLTHARQATQEERKDGQGERVRKLVDFSTTPGHRRASLHLPRLPSLRPPSITPKLNASTEARLQRDHRSSSVLTATSSSRAPSRSASSPSRSPAASTTLAASPPSSSARRPPAAPPSSYRHSITLFHA